MPDNKRELANSELPDIKQMLESGIISAEELQEYGIELPEEVKDNLDNNPITNNVNVNVNVSGDTKINKTNVTPNITKIVNNVLNQSTNSPDEIKKNSEESLPGKNGNDGSSVVVNEDSDTNKTPQNYSSNNKEEEVRSYTYNTPFRAATPLLFNLDNFTNTKPSNYTQSIKIIKNPNTQKTYDEINNIVSQSISSISSGGISKSIYHESNLTNLVIEDNSDNSLNRVSQESKQHQYNTNIIEEQKNKTLEQIAKNTSQTANVEATDFLGSNQNMIPVQMKNISSNDNKIFLGEQTIRLFANDKNSPPEWRTVLG